MPETNRACDPKVNRRRKDNIHMFAAEFPQSPRGECDDIEDKVYYGAYWVFLSFVYIDYAGEFGYGVQKLLLWMSAPSSLGLVIWWYMGLRFHP